MRDLTGMRSSPVRRFWGSGSVIDPLTGRPLDSQTVVQSTSAAPSAVSARTYRIEPWGNITGHVPTAQQLYDFAARSGMDVVQIVQTPGGPWTLKTQSSGVPLSSPPGWLLEFRNHYLRAWDQIGGPLAAPPWQPDWQPPAVQTQSTSPMLPNYVPPPSPVYVAPAPAPQPVYTAPVQPSQPICPQNYDPVQGADGQTYSNDCFRRAAGVELASPGPQPQPEPQPGLAPGELTRVTALTFKFLAVGGEWKLRQVLQDVPQAGYMGTAVLHQANFPIGGREPQLDYLAHVGVKGQQIVSMKVRELPAGDWQLVPVGVAGSGSGSCGCYGSGRSGMRDLTGMRSSPRGSGCSCKPQGSGAGQAKPLIVSDGQSLPVELRSLNQGLMNMSDLLDLCVDIVTSDGYEGRGYIQLNAVTPNFSAAIEESGRAVGTERQEMEALLAAYEGGQATKPQLRDRLTKLLQVWELVQRQFNRIPAIVEAAMRRADKEGHVRGWQEAIKYVEEHQKPLLLAVVNRVFDSVDHVAKEVAEVAKKAAEEAGKAAPAAAGIAALALGLLGLFYLGSKRR